MDIFTENFKNLYLMYKYYKVSAIHETYECKQNRAQLNAVLFLLQCKKIDNLHIYVHLKISAGSPLIINPSQMHTAMDRRFARFFVLLHFVSCSSRPIVSSHATNCCVGGRSFGVLFTHIHAISRTCIIWLSWAVSYIHGSNTSISFLSFFI